MRRRELILSFTRPKDFKPVSLIIRLIDGMVPYSHIVLRWHSSSLGRDLLYHSSMRGVGFESYQRFIQYNHIVKSYKLNIPAERFNDMVRLCIDLAGAKYDFISVLKIFLQKLINWIGFKRFSFKDKGRERLFCSELAGYILQSFSFRCTKDINLDTFTPKDLDNLLGSCDEKEINQRAS